MYDSDMTKLRVCTLQIYNYTYFVIIYRRCAVAVPVEPCSHAFIQLSNEPKWDYDVFLCHEGGSKALRRKLFNALAYKHIRAFLDDLPLHIIFLTFAGL